KWQGSVPHERDLRRPRREYRSAQREGRPLSAPSRPKREYRSAPCKGKPLRLDPSHTPAERRDGQRRRIVLAGQPIEYRLIRARRRSIGMEVHLEGLTVRA